MGLADEYRKKYGPLADGQVARLCQQLAENQEVLEELKEHGLPVNSGMLAKVSGVKDFQLRIVVPCVGHIIDSTTAGVTYSGLENVTQGAILAATHTDILFDSSVVNWILANEGRETTFIAAGSNLFVYELATLLMRANKTYGVVRAKASKSDLIGLSEMVNKDCRIGQAHFISSEGRAKDGRHRLGAKVVKMWMLSTGLSASEYVTKQAIVPVSITYEFIPDAERMAGQRLASAQDPGWKKAPDEDLKSMLSGLFGWKDRVHVAFGKRVIGQYDSPDAVAASIDAENHRNARLFPTHHLGYTAIERGIVVARNSLQQFKPEERSAARLWESMQYFSERKQMAILEQYGNVAKDHYAS